MSLSCKLLSLGLSSTVFISTLANVKSSDDDESLEWHLELPCVSFKRVLLSAWIKLAFFFEKQQAAK